MINLEKLFQKDDEIYVAYSHFSQSIIIFISLYVASIVKENVILELFIFNLFLTSDFFYFTLAVFFLHIFSFYFFKKHKNYIKTFYYFCFYELKTFILSYVLNILIFLIFFNLKIDNWLWLFNSLVFCIINLFLLKIINNQIYKYLIINNIIQRNVILIANFSTIKNFIELYKNKNKKSLIKCCIIKDKIDSDYFNELKIPSFNFNDNFFDILNYHYIGQIWYELDDQSTDNSKIKVEELLKFPFDIKVFIKEGNENLIRNFSDKINIASTFERRKNYLFYSLNNSRFTGLPLLIKFFLDKIFSIIILILTLPITISSIILIIIEDGFPFIFTQQRTGWDGRKFKIYKLRTLKKENFDKTQQVMHDDKRLLFFGKFIRRLSIDELPQLYNVLIGDMSIVGPRPHMIEHSKKYSKIIQNFLTRHKCNPGITGWAQVHGFRGATPDDMLMKKRMDYDIWYLKNWSLSLDFLIMLKTFYAILKYKAD